MVGLQSGVCACKFSSTVWMGVVFWIWGRGRSCLAASDRVVAAKTSLSGYLTAKVNR